MCFLYRIFNEQHDTYISEKFLNCIFTSNYKETFKYDKSITHLVYL